MDSAWGEVQLRPIGIVRSPFAQAAGSPIQSCFAEAAEGAVELFAEFAPALRDIEGMDRIWLVYGFHRASAPSLQVCPYLDTVEHGVFATRAPARPNLLGLSAVRLLGRDGNILRIACVDILDGSPLYDIKPYVPRFDSFPDCKAGWFDAQLDKPVIADNRFEAGSEDSA